MSIVPSKVWLWWDWSGFFLFYGVCAKYFMTEFHKPRVHTSYKSEDVCWFCALMSADLIASIVCMIMYTWSKPHEQKRCVCVSACVRCALLMLTSSQLSLCASLSLSQCRSIKGCHSLFIFYSITSWLQFLLFYTPHTHIIYTPPTHHWFWFYHQMNCLCEIVEFVIWNWYLIN